MDAANEVSEVSGLVLWQAQVLPRREARGMHFVHNSACKDWLEGDRLTVIARMCIS